MATQTPYIYSGDKVGDLNVITTIWGMFVSVTLQAAVHLENDYAQNLHSIKNQPKRTLKHLFNVTEKLIRDQKEISGIPVITWQQLMWQRTTLLTDKGVQFATAQTYVFSNSLLCMGGISSNPVKAWKEKIDWFMNSRHYRGLDRIDGEPTEFEWKNFPGFTTLQILAEIQTMMTEIKCEPEQFHGRIIFMSMFYGIVWGEKETEKLVLRILVLLQIMLENSRKDICRFLGLDQKRSGTELTYNNQMENGTMSLMS